MLIYDRKDDKIEIYDMSPKILEMKKYRKGVISRHKNDGLIYSLKTNCDRVKKDFDECREMVLPSLDFYNIHGSYFGTEYSKLQLRELELDIIEKYLQGLYDNLELINIVKYYENHKDIVHRFLKTGSEEKNINGHRSWEFNNLIDLPKELYLLQLLLLGRYDCLLDENIRKQLSLFDINYLRSLSILDVKNMLDTGLVSGTMDSVMEKVNIGQKILSKRK